MHTILSILPKGEGFAPGSFGAIALCVRDFTLNSNYRNAIMIAGGTSPTGFEGINYRYMPKGKWYQNHTRYYASQCANYINNHTITLAEIHNRPHFLKILAKQVNCKLALHLHNDPLEMQSARTVRERTALLSHCDAIYCVSQYIKNRFMEGLEAHHAARIHVVYNGLAIPESMPEKENRIVFAGRMTKGKGARLLAEALRIALPRLPRWKAVIIGSQRHQINVKLSDYEKEILAIVEPLGIQVEMPGFLSHEETLGYFARSAIAVVPSVWNEPFGRTALEAMAYGCALVSSGSGGLKEITAEAALTVLDMTPSTLADALLLVANDASMRSLLQSQARERAQHFAIKEVTMSLDTARKHIMEQVLSCKIP